MLTCNIAEFISIEAPIMKQTIGLEKRRKEKVAGRGRGRVFSPLYLKGRDLVNSKFHATICKS